jgi:hypothetical protein
MNTNRAPAWWEKVLVAKFAFGVFIAAFAIIWGLAEPLGLPHGFALWLQIFIWASLSSILWMLVCRLHAMQLQVAARDAAIAHLTEDLRLANANRSSCCVLKQEAAVCPLGITAIRDHAQDTVKSSLAEPKHSFKWIGLSGFNVVHNNWDIFEAKKQVDYEFLTVAPDNERLIAAIDEYYMTPTGIMKSGELVAKSNTLIKEIATGVHQKLRVRHYNQMPTFRVILIDDNKALVSFYERGQDALKTQQIEITESPQAKYCILKWFQMFYDKVALTETLGIRTK